MKAMLRCMKYIVDRPNCGLVLQPDVLYYDDPKTSFIVSNRTDSDYAKGPITRRSVSGGRVMLNGVPVKFRSSMQKTVALLVMETELYAAVMTAQDVLYVLHVLESIGLQAQLPMILEVDNKGTMDLENIWSVGGQTRNIDVHQTFLHELKEEGKLLVKWLPGKDNVADMFTNKS